MGLINDEHGKELLSVSDGSKWEETEDEMFFFFFSVSMAKSDLISCNATITLRARVLWFT